MTDEKKHGDGGPFGHGNYEHQDLASKGILYFLLALAVGTAICFFGLRGLYSVLDAQVRSQQPMSPLITSVPEDTLHIPAGYPQTAFPSPRLEEDERGQLDDIRLRWDNQLYSYGWVDQQAGTVRLPIDRAMDLLAQRGLPTRSAAKGSDESPTPENKVENQNSTNQPAAASGQGEMK
jgi:hypothetical protein